MNESVAQTNSFSNEILLYGHYDSGHVYKVALCLRLLGLDYRYEHVDIWIDKSARQSDFLNSSRNAEVPCLVLDSRPLIQSNVILQALARKYRRFGGESEERLLTALDWQFWEANRLGMCLPQLRYARLFAPQEFTSDSLAFLHHRFNEDIAVLSRHFADGRQFVLDDNPSIADFSLCGYLYWAQETAVEIPKSVADWLDRISAIKGWQSPYIIMEKARYAPS